MITKNMLISEVLEHGDPDKMAQVLGGFGMHCLMCMLSHGETIEQAAAVHNVDVNEVIDALNAAIEK